MDGWIDGNRRRLKTKDVFLILIWMTEHIRKHVSHAHVHPGNPKSRKKTHLFYYEGPVIQILSFSHGVHVTNKE